MIRRTVHQIQKMIKVENDLAAFQDVSIDGVSIDSRKIAPGNLFIPFKGEHSDGHRFVEDALKKGAAATLWQKDVPNPPANLPIIVVEDTLTALQELSRNYRNELDVKVVGITGSNGKTTVKDMTANLLSLKYKVQKTEGNYNNHIGMPLTILSLYEDTDIAVLEMGMSGRGEIEFLSKLARPDVAIITNIGESHLQDLGSREAIAAAKMEIIEGLKKNGLIIYLGDELLLSEGMSNYTGSAEIKTFGRLSTNDLYPVELETNQNGSTFKINGEETEFSLPVLGGHNVLNALSAMLAAQFFQIPFHEMNNGFAGLKLTNMRMELVEGKNGEKIINDAYNASPTSMKVAVDLVSNLPDYERKILVLGDMLELGEKENEFHFEMGKYINPEKVDYVFTFGRLGEEIAAGARSIFTAERVFSFTDKPALIERLKNCTNEETLVLVKASRGMKLEEVVNALIE
ncbi:UDP-N-acetylmuramoyl-tripeptide--D-alanyl-D-alanine ligase [Niallia endozanthoxylica]|uniref:UDP-N-acetylmuramoyl-tripeptide--D-alanyl-D-alanine ligase n=1 Tax=Niallia endozanthoxylica TaxID=2036016 RepID=A0A5J5HBS7_9BACI|nr:UDP-N-acetylmuramoyl-tripeptide--D-alanyl-D-alanine ligase [Niallia endozanthoxylica]KAA9017093.1 UDP-N-acetylmuramoyl-tripeptide--D-alanyl-D-alanine ligase [Niallia endozanthoxylica]